MNNFRKLIPTKRFDYIILGFLLLFFTLVWLQHIHSPFFYDEAVYVNLAHHPFHSDYYSDPIFFRHPPLHYLLLALVGKLCGFGEVAMRVPSLVFSGLSVILVYFLGSALDSRKVGLLSSVFLVFSTLYQQYAQAATMYAIAAFFMTFCIYGMVRKKNWIIGIGFFGSIATHFFGLYLLPPLLFYIWKSSGQRISLRQHEVRAMVISLIILCPILLPGALFHLSRIPQAVWWFQWVNTFLHLSLPLFLGAFFYIWTERRNQKLQPVFIFVLSFLISSVVFVKFVRYLIPFFPVFLVLGVLGCVSFYRKTKISHMENWFLKILVFFFFILMVFGSTFGAFGVYPTSQLLAGEGDMIYAQEWDKVVPVIPSGTVLAMPEIPFMYYTNLQLVPYSLLVPRSDEELITELNNAIPEWVVIQKYFIYSSFNSSIEQDSRYEIYRVFSHTLIFKKK